MSESNVTVVAPAAPVEQRSVGRSAIAALAHRLGVETGDLFLRSLKTVAFKAPDVTNEQLMALVLVANQYQLNPFTKELYAFPDKGGGIVPIVSVDGWYRIINEHPQFDGLEYVEGHEDPRGLYGECTIFRKDRSHPIKIREWAQEVVRNTDTWRIYKSRMLRHKTIIQCSRIAFGFAGIFDPDEGERILLADQPAAAPASALKGAARLEAILTPAAPVVEKAAETAKPVSAALLGDDEEARVLQADAERMMGGGDDAP